MFEVKKERVMANDKPALGLIELKSVARGIYVTDVVVKKAPVDLLGTHPICPGKYLIVFVGETAPVKESLDAGIAAAGDSLVNELFLPQVHETVIPAIRGTAVIEKFGAIGIIETFSVATCVVAGDIAAKASEATLIEMRLGNGLGGKAYFTLTGDLYSVEASMSAAGEHVRQEGLLAGMEIIPAPHADLIEKGVYW